MFSVSSIKHRTIPVLAVGLLSVAALVVWVLLAYKGVKEKELWFDSIWYHLPFAARLFGIIPESQFQFLNITQARFEGYPIFGQFLQGLLWKLTGSIQSARFVGYCSCLGFVLYLKKLFRVPLVWSTFALLAVPMVTVHLTNLYVDLIHAVFVSVAMLSALSCILLYNHTALGKAIAGQHRSADVFNRHLIAAVIGVSGAVWTKYSFVHILLLLTPLFIAWLAFIKYRQLGNLRLFCSWCCFTFFPILGVVLPFMFFPLIKNMWLHRGPPFYSNPFMPVAVKLPFLYMGGIDESMTHFNVSALKHLPRAVVWLWSVFNINVFPGLDGSTLSCKNLAQIGCKQFFYGFFSWYVMFQCALLWVNLRLGGFDKKTAAITGLGFGLFSALVASSPSMYNLRYSLAWMLIIVSLNLLMLVSSAPRWFAWLALLGARLALTRQALSFALIGGVFFFWFLLITNFTEGRHLFVQPKNQPYSEAVTEEMAVFEYGMRQAKKPYKTICRRLPWGWQNGLLFTHYFHPVIPYSYQIQDADCSTDALILNKTVYKQWEHDYLKTQHKNG